jgi:hypothetical protein
VSGAPNKSRLRNGFTDVVRLQRRTFDVAAERDARQRRASSPHAVIGRCSGFQRCALWAEAIDSIRTQTRAGVSSIARRCTGRCDLPQELRERGALDRLYKVHVETCFLRARAIVVIVIAGQRCEKYFTAAKRLAYAARDFVPIDVRKPEIDQRNVGTLLECKLDRAQTFCGFIHDVAVGHRKQHAQCCARIAVVFDDQDFELRVQLTGRSHFKRIPANDRSLMTPRDGHGSCLEAHMEPIPINALAVTWEFRCHGNEVPGHPWNWHCRSRDGAIVARSQVFFRSLQEAVADANNHGFRYEMPAEER